MKFLRRLYDWVLHWADTPYAVPALFLLAFAESSFFPVPPDILLIALAISIPTRSFRYAMVCTAGSIIGGVVGYIIGFYGYEAIGRPIVEFYHAQGIMSAIKMKYDQFGFWGVLVAAITPIPYKVFTISSGFFRFDLWLFLLASVIGRSLRFFAVGALIWKFGAPVKGFIDRYFNLLGYIFIILLVGGFIVIKYLL
ncbi:SNARE associated Golgi protein [bacterium BMS3Abin07]|nr:SNARE associated Golgi protein [bacterium BMS3Abin07]GBE32135.1 SNARE associated Golgi protein [bacterium BMS3Bbin05]HDL20603.1 DedA family protein [Nitrospirota bacterium]HDO22217.1 DedA family protein [Nitrospirota bacterium]HDZ88844.1 DedA family protein [Nitrospirota bacterium]